MLETESAADELSIYSAAAPPEFRFLPQETEIKN
jgi:hypothetical protein